MSGPEMLRHIVLERLAWREQPRVPEPRLVMDNADQMEAFWRCGKEDGVLAPLYFFNAVHSLPAIWPGDRVLDLACGPANQLAQIARLHPDAKFVGIDIAQGMLELAWQTLQRLGLNNVELRQVDISDLSEFSSASFDAVTCTLSLHHLPDEAALRQTMREVHRVLKPGAGIYLADFGRLKRVASQQYFAHDRADEQTPLFTQDYLNSLRAAFSLPELTAAVSILDPVPQRFQTGLAPFMLIFRRARSGPLDASVQARVRRGYASLSRSQQRDFHAMTNWFRLSGLILPLSLP